MKAILFAVAIVLFAATPVFTAQNGPAPTQVAQGLLTAAELDRYIQDIPKIQSWAESKGKTLADITNIDMAKAKGYSGEVESYLKGLSWSPERFYAVTSRVLGGLSRDMLGPQGSAFMDGLGGQISRMIDGSQNVSGDVKAEGQRMLNSALGDAKNAAKNLDPREMQLIQSRRGELMTLLSGLLVR